VSAEVGCDALISIFLHRLISTSGAGGGRCCFDRRLSVCLSVSKVTLKSYAWIFVKLVG